MYERGVRGVYPPIQKTYPRVYARPYPAAMKFDVAEINRMSPPNLCGLRLWDLGVLVSVIAMLRGVIASGNGSVLLYGRMVVRYSESLRERTRDNLNMRIKAWVLQCPRRIAHVRRIIGEAAIRNWRKNRLADYALTKYFGDWRRKFPNGFSHKSTKPKRQAAPKYNGQTRAYNWKFFALVKIVNVRDFLYANRTSNAKKNAEEQEMQAASYKLWGVAPEGALILRTWKQPRGARTRKPILFTPNELEVEPEEAAAIEPPILVAQEAPKRIEGEVQSDTETRERLLDWQPP